MPSEPFGSSPAGGAGGGGRRGDRVRRGWPQELLLTPRTQKRRRGCRRHSSSAVAQPAAVAAPRQRTLRAAEAHVLGLLSGLEDPGSVEDAPEGHAGPVGGAHARGAPAEPVWKKEGDERRRRRRRREVRCKRGGVAGITARQRQQCPSRRPPLRAHPIVCFTMFCSLRRLPAHTSVTGMVWHGIALIW